MSNKKDIQEMLVSMGFPVNYIQRAFKVYEKNYGSSYNVEVITEIIVRLQNKDNAKKGGKEKSPQPKDAKPASASSSVAASSSAANKSSPSKAKPSANDSASKHMKKEPHHGNAPSTPNNASKRAGAGGAANKHSNNSNKKPPPPNSSNSSNLPAMGGMNRASSNPNKKKHPPKTPPPSNPLPNQPSPYQQTNNNQASPSKAHVKSQSNSSAFASQHASHQSPPRGSPAPPLRFAVNDRVLFKGIEAEVMKVIDANQIEITYPADAYIMQRQKAVVAAAALQKKSSHHSTHSGKHQYSSSQSYGGKQVNINMNGGVGGGNNMSNNNNRHTMPPQRGRTNGHNTAITPSQSSTNGPSTATATATATATGTTKGSKGTASGATPSGSSSSSSVPPFENHMQVQEAYKLKIHDKIDHRDQVGRFVYATVSEKQGTNLKIHYDGWSRKWDTWSDFVQELHRFAKPGSISKRPAHRFQNLKKGDYVDINPTQRHPGWKCGEIRRLDQKSGQVQVVYECGDKNYLYWAHLDNAHEIAEFTSKSGTMHATQMDILGKNQHGSPQQAQPQMNQQAFNQAANKSMQQRPNTMISGGQQGFNQQQQGYGMMANNQAQPQQQGYGAMGHGQAAQQGYNNQAMTMQQQQQMAMQQPQREPMDEMEAFARIRAKRFPRYQNETIDNPYSIGDWLEVQDTQTHQWITATVIDKENNWIVVHFDGWPSKYDQKIHAVKHKKRLRALGSGLQETQEEKDIKEEMNNFLQEVEQLNWKLVVVDADGNCLYRCFATEIYGDTGQHLKVRADCCKYMRSNLRFFQNFIPDFEERMKEKEQEYEWGDHVDITALSELYNVRVRVFEYDKDQKKLYMSFDQGEHDQTTGLPLVLLARHRKKHYNIITDPQAVHQRPLGTAQHRVEQNKKRQDEHVIVSLRELRLREDAKEREHKDDEKEVDDDDNNNNNGGVANNNNNNRDNNASSNANVQSPSFSSHSHSHQSFNPPSSRNLYSISGPQIIDHTQFKLDLNSADFGSVLEMWNLQEPLAENDLNNIWEPLLSKVKKNLDQQWQAICPQIDKQILSRFWKQQFDKQSAQSAQNCKRWITSLNEKNPTGQFAASTSLTTFNQTIVASIADNLAHLVTTRKRVSTIDIHRQQQQMQSQAMDVDK